MPCHLTKPAWTHLKLLKLQSVSNKPPRLLLSFNLFLSYPDARLPLMHNAYYLTPIVVLFFQYVTRHDISKFMEVKRHHKEKNVAKM
jgi:hypothetical protein